VRLRARIRVLRTAPEPLVFGLLFFFTPLGALVGGLAYLGYSERFPLAVSIPLAVLSAALIGFIPPSHLLLRQREGTLSRVPEATYDEIWSISHRRELEIERPYDEVFSLCRKGVEEVMSTDPVRERVGALLQRDLARADYGGGLVTARGADSRLRVEVYGRPGQSTRVVIHGGGRRLQVFDEGKNLHNVVQLERFLRSDGGTDVPRSSP
jgi:hypothetical protein